MVIDGAPSHRSGHLVVPENMALVRLPPYSPELNPVEYLWDELREKDFANRVFDTLGAAIAQAARGLKRMEENLIMIARWNEMIIPWFLCHITGVGERLPVR